MVGKKRKSSARKKTSVRTHKATPSRSPRSRRSEKNTSPTNTGNIIKSLKLASELYSQKKIADTIKILDGLDAGSLSGLNIIEYYRLLAYSCANSDRLTEAEAAAIKGMELNSDDRDFPFVLSFIYASFKDYDKCLEFGGNFEKLALNKKSESRPGKFLSDGHHHLLFNYLGIAYKAMNEMKKAEDAFRRVIELIPSDEQAYLNLANMYLRLNDYDKAGEIVKDGLRKCSQVQELRMLEKTLENKATICACMIVKNEEELLPGCLESIRSWIDDIIIVDTGSTDRTVEIARSYGAKVYFQEWEGSFSKARNFSISKATCDWILYIDADEEFVQEDVPLLRQAISQGDHRLVSVVINNVNRKTGEGSSSLTYNRVFRSDAGFYFDGIVHNQLKYADDEPILRTPVRLKHYGYHLDPEKMKKKLARSRTLLEKQIEENPDNGFAHFNLAQLLRSVSIQDDPKAHSLGVKHAEKVIELTSQGKSIHLMAHDQIASFYYAMKQFGRAEEYSLKALELQNDYLDPLLLLALIYQAMDKNDKAEEYCYRYLKEQSKQIKMVIPDGMLIAYLRARHVAYRTLGQVWLAREDLKKAGEFFRKALNEQEPFQDLYIRLSGVYLDLKEPDKALEFIDKELVWHPDSDLAHLFMGRYFSMRGDLEKAEIYYGKALELTEGNALVLQKAGSFFAEYGKPENAVIAYRRLTECYPDNVSGWKLLAKISYEMAQYVECKKSLQVYLKFKPNDPEIFNNLGNCLFNLEEFGEAERYFEKAMEIDDGQPSVYRGLGLTRYRLGKSKEALALLEKYRSFTPDDVNIELTIGSIYGQIGEYSSAIQHFERLLMANPGHIEGLYHLSECYRLMGHIDSAAIGYEQILKLKSDYRPARQRLREIEIQKTPT